MPSLARLFKRFRAAGTNGRLDLSLTCMSSIHNQEFDSHPEQ